MEKKAAHLHWTKEQFAQREAVMESRSPGYYDRKLTVQVLLGGLLFIRGFYIALSGILQIQDAVQIFTMTAGLVISYLYYRILIMGYIPWLAPLLLILRCGEFAYTLYSSLGFLFYMNFIGTCWWVTSMFAILADVVFLIYMIVGKKAQLLKFDNRILYSDAELSCSEEMI